MAQDINVKLDVELVERALAYATRRGISFDQLVAQQLERVVSNDEYTAARRQVTLGQRARRNSAEQILRDRIKSS